MGRFWSLAVVVMVAFASACGAASQSAQSESSVVDEDRVTVVSLDLEGRVPEERVVVGIRRPPSEEELSVVRPGMSGLLSSSEIEALLGFEVVALAPSSISGPADVFDDVAIEDCASERVPGMLERESGGVDAGFDVFQRVWRMESVEDSERFAGVIARGLAGECLTGLTKPIDVMTYPLPAGNGERIEVLQDTPPLPDFVAIESFAYHAELDPGLGDPVLHVRQTSSVVFHGEWVLETELTEFGYEWFTEDERRVFLENAEAIFLNVVDG